MKTAPNVIVGGGIIGLLAAWYLIKAGKTVLIVERGCIGQESSWAGGGILSPLYPHRYPAIGALVHWSQKEYPQLVEELVALTRMDPQLIPSELLLLGEKMIRHAESGRSRARVITAGELERIEPALKVSTDGAICYPSAQVRNPRLVSALRTALAKKGVVFYESCEVRAFRSEQSHLSGLLTSRGAIEASCCIVTAGAWTSELLTPTYLRLPIRPIKGQIIVFAARPGLIRHIIVHQYRYLIPRSDGRILVGSTIEDVGYEKEITVAARQELCRAALDLVPALREYPIEHHWAGLRPGSPDDAPFIGEHPEIKGLFVCAGHYRNGFATGPASARLVVDMLLGRPPDVDPSPFRLDRPLPEWKI